jgi:hypothetical protein
MGDGEVTERRLECGMDMLMRKGYEETKRETEHTSSWHLIVPSWVLLRQCRVRGEGRWLLFECESHVGRRI